ncbi:amidohydrolase family protein [Pseudomonadota bacterium]
MAILSKFKVFDSHFHIIDENFPLVSNQGFLPDFYPISDYLERTRDYNIVGGAIVSASFQGFDQTYLLAALKALGPTFVGVAQLPPEVSDDELIRLNAAGVRAVRFNLRRGGFEEIENLERFAKRLYEMLGWHAEIYVDSTALSALRKTLVKLPSLSIDHLGLSKAGYSDLLYLVEYGARIKATGFGRVDFDVKQAIKEISAINTNALLFGTDLPSTRVLKPYSDEDFLMVIEAIGERMARKVFYENAINFYRPQEMA